MKVQKLLFGLLVVLAMASCSAESVAYKPAKTKIKKRTPTATMVVTKIATSAPARGTFVWCVRYPCPGIP